MATSNSSSGVGGFDGGKNGGRKRTGGGRRRQRSRAPSTSGDDSDELLLPPRPSPTSFLPPSSIFHRRDYSTGSLYSVSSASASSSRSERQEQQQHSASHSAYSPLHKLIPTLPPPTPLTPASFIRMPDEADTPLSSDFEEELDGLGLVESFMTTQRDLAERNAATGVTNDNTADNQNSQNLNTQNMQRAETFECQTSLAEHWSNFTFRYRAIIILAFLLLCPVGLFFCLPSTIRSADSTFEPPPGSPSYRALEVYRAAYGGIKNCGGSKANTDNITKNDAGTKNENRHPKSPGQSTSDPLNPPVFVVMGALPSSQNETGVFGERANLVDGWSDLYKNADQYATGIEGFLRLHSPLMNEYLVPCQCRSNCSNNTTKFADQDTNSTIFWTSALPDLSVISYYSLSKRGLSTTLAPVTVAADKETAVVEISFSIPPSVAESGHVKRQYVAAIMKSLEDYDVSTAQNGTAARGFTVSYTGLRYLERDLTSSVQDSLHRMDFFVFPLALTVLAMVLSSTGTETSRTFHRMSLFVILPIVVIGSTVALWSILLFCLSRWSSVQISHFTPTIMLSITIAMGLDYIMFMTSRALGEAGSRHTTGSSARSTTINIIGATLSTAGHTVMKSGITLSVAFLGLVTLPLPMLRSAGLGATIAILSCIVVTLVLLPALMHTSWVAKQLFDPSRAKADQNARRHRRRWRRGSGDIPKLFGPGGIFDDKDTSGTGMGFVWFSGISLSADGRSRAGESNNNIDNGGEFNGSGIPSTGSEETDAAHEYTSFRDLAQPLLSEDRNMENHENGERSIQANNRSSCSLWRRFALLLLNPYGAFFTLFAVFAIILPIVLHCFHMDTSMSFELMLPTQSPAMVAAHKLANNFGRGSLSPYRIIFDGRNVNKEVDTEESFEVMHAVVTALIKYDLNETSNVEADISPSFHFPFGSRGHGTEGQNRTAFNGIAHAKGINIPHALFASAKICKDDFDNCLFENLRALCAMDEVMTSPDRLTTYMTATLAVSPFSDEGVIWLKAARRIINELGQQDALRNYTVVIEGEAAVEHDVVQETYRTGPFCIGMTLFVILILFAVFFKSLIVPIRSIVCIGLTQAFAFGMLVLTYQENLFDWTGMENLIGTGEISWLSPVLSFSIIVGLCLDYEIFLIDRVLEFRLQGANHKSSIVAGFHETGPIISAAGIIMAIAFGGLMLSPSPALYQWSFLLAMAVLFDISIGRIVRVVVLGVTSKYSWWPRPLPAEEINLPVSSQGDDGEEEDRDEDYDDDESNEDKGSISHMRRDELL